MHGHFLNGAASPRGNATSIGYGHVTAMLTSRLPPLSTAASCRGAVIAVVGVGVGVAVAYSLLMNRRAANRRTRWGRMYLEKT